MSTGAGKRGVGSARRSVRRKAATKIQRAVRKRQSQKKKVGAAKTIQKAFREKKARKELARKTDKSVKDKIKREVQSKLTDMLNKRMRPSSNTRSKGKEAK